MDPRDRSAQPGSLRALAAVVPPILLMLALLAILHLSEVDAAATAAASGPERSRLGTRIQAAVEPQHGHRADPIDKRAAVILESLREAGSIVRVMTPEGRIVASEDETPSELPAAVARTSGDRLAMALEADVPVGFEDDGWLTVLAGVDAGTASPGIVMVSRRLEVPSPAQVLVRFLQVAVPVALLACVLGLLGARAARPRRGRGGNGPAPLPSGDRELVDRLAAERSQLIRAAIDVRDAVSSVSLAYVLDQALAAAGVAPVNADGAFDPDRHRAVDRVATDDPALHDQIASTERVGYQDHGKPIRPPDVVVYQLVRRPG